MSIIVPEPANAPVTAVWETVQEKVVLENPGDNIKFGASPLQTTAEVVDGKTTGLGFTLIKTEIELPIQVLYVGVIVYVTSPWI